MNKATAFVKSHWPVIAAFGMAAWAEYGTSVMKYVATHPHASAAVGFVVFTVGWFKAYYTQPKPS